jgi:tetrahydromethanopterin S-methyltransferase subunit G
MQQELLTKKDFQIYVNSSDARFSSIERRLDTIESRLDAIESRLDAIESRLDKLEAEFRDFKQEITHLITTEIQALAKYIVANMQEQERKWNEQIRLNQYFSGRISDLEVAAA